MGEYAAESAGVGPDPTIVRIRTLIEAGRHEEARVKLESVLASEPGDGGLWCLYALCLCRLDRPAEALQAAGRAAALEPDEEWPHRLASIALCSLQDYPRAAEAARAAVRLEPGLWQTHAQLALALHEVKNVDAMNEAWQSADHAVSLAPDEAETHFVMGVVAQERGAVQVAESAYRRVLALDPAHAAAMNNLGLLQLKRGRLHEAAEGFTSSLRNDPNLGVARANVDAVGWRLMTIAYYIAFGGFWVLRFLVETSGPYEYLLRAGMGVVLLGVWIIVGLRMLGRLPSAARRYLARLPRRSSGFGIMAGGVTLCVLGSLFAAFAPGPVSRYGLGAAAVGISVSFVTSWVVTIRNWRSRNRTR